MNTITIIFDTCEPAPANGYNVIWRVKGSSDPYTDAGNFFSSPAIFADGTNPDGTDYEGFIRSDCTTSGDSGTVYGNNIPWETGSGAASGATIAKIECHTSNIESTYLVSNVNPGDIVTVRATFSGVLQKLGNLFTRADLNINSSEGTSGNASSACYTDTSSHGFSIFADTVITVVGTDAVVGLVAVVHNSSETPTGVTLTIIDVNGSPHDASVSGCRGNSSTGGTC